MLFVAKRKRRRPAKRKSNKHNGRKRKDSVQQSHTNEREANSTKECQNESYSDQRDSDDSTPENEEFPVVLQVEAPQLQGKFTNH